MKVKGLLNVGQAQWKLVYQSILNYVNEEVAYSYAEALKIYQDLQANKHSAEEPKSLSDCLSSEYNEFHLSYILPSLTKEGSDNLYKPKKNAFKKYTNRTTEVNLYDFHIIFDKVTNVVSFTSSELDIDDVTQLASQYSFIGQFINMIETITWPTRQVRKATRGASIVYSLEEDVWHQFYSAGPNPPEIPHSDSIVVPEPKFLKTSSLKTLKISPPLSAETHTNPIMETVDKEFI